jgi:hypothetical protein
MKQMRKKLIVLRSGIPASFPPISTCKAGKPLGPQRSKSAFSLAGWSKRTCPARFTRQLFAPQRRAPEAAAPLTPFLHTWPARMQCCHCRKLYYDCCQTTQSNPPSLCARPKHQNYPKCSKRVSPKVGCIRLSAVIHKQPHYRLAALIRGLHKLSTNCTTKPIPTTNPIPAEKTITKRSNN